MAHRDEMRGIYRATSGSYGFFSPEEGGEDCFVPPSRAGSAWEGDRVAVRPIPGEEERRTAVEVVRVVERAHERVTGVLQKESRRWLLWPTDPKLPAPLTVVGGLHNARSGDRVGAAVQSFAYGHGQQPSVRLTEIFGPAGEFATIVEAILYDHDIPTRFDPAAMEQADALPENPGEEDFVGRLDLRDRVIFTIDGASSRDFDDAVSLERDERGNRVLGVHIAHVSHYVPLGSALDEEAFGRGTSVYFADRVVPMLPIALSNGLCSLNEGVDRLALSCFMTVDERGEIIGYNLAKTVIRSQKRMTYEAVNSLLEGEAPAGYEEYKSLLTDMDTLARQRAKLRRLRGSLTLESRELTVQCDENGEPVGLALRESGRGESLIEEFMLAANETVAKHLWEARVPAVYRLHEPPAPDKVEALRAALAPLGYQVGSGDSFALQKVVDEVRGKPESPMVNTLLLRAQKKARYDRENPSHFALAAPCYCHFTSPIRRYPDLMIHRALTALLEEGGNGPTLHRLAKVTGEGAWQSSLREQEAAEAEREIEKRYAARWLAAHVGETFPGAVSGVTRFGLFVQLTCGAEGRLPVECLPAEYYEFDETTLRLFHGDEVYTIGTPVTVVVTAAHVESGQVELALEGVTPRAVERTSPAERTRAPEKRGQTRGTGRKNSFKPPRPKAGRKGRRR